MSRGEGEMESDTWASISLKLLSSPAAPFRHQSTISICLINITYKKVTWKGEGSSVYAPTMCVSAAPPMMMMCRDVFPPALPADPTFLTRQLHQSSSLPPLISPSDLALTKQEVTPPPPSLLRHLLFFFLFSPYSSSTSSPTPCPDGHLPAWWRSRARHSCSFCSRCSRMAPCILEFSRRQANALLSPPHLPPVNSPPSSFLFISSPIVFPIVVSFAEINVLLMFLHK